MQNAVRKNTEYIIITQPPLHELNFLSPRLNKKIYKNSELRQLPAPKFATIAIKPPEKNY